MPLMVSSGEKVLLMDRLIEEQERWIRHHISITVLSPRGEGGTALCINTFSFSLSHPCMQCGLSGSLRAWACSFLGKGLEWPGILSFLIEPINVMLELTAAYSKFAWFASLDIAGKNPSQPREMQSATSAPHRSLQPWRPGHEQTFPASNRRTRRPM